MKIKSKVSKVVSKSDMPTGKITKKAAVKTVVAKVKSVISRFYVQLRGTALNLCNCRKADYTGQAFTDAPKGAKPAIVVVQGTYGTTVSSLPAAGKVVQIDKNRGFDLSQVRGADVLHPVEAAKLFKKMGKAHIVRQGKTETKGLLLGNLDDMYVGFLDTAKGVFRTLETQAISDKRNKANLFSLAK